MLREFKRCADCGCMRPLDTLKMWIAFDGVARPYCLDTVWCAYGKRVRLEVEAEFAALQERERAAADLREETAIRAAQARTLEAENMRRVMAGEVGGRAYSKCLECGKQLLAPPRGKAPKFCGQQHRLAWWKAENKRRRAAP